jgi:choline dehydrogenase-like flavoprotein
MAAPPSDEGDYDAIIVGAGSAGCVLANRLSGGGRRVLLLEAGGTDDWIWFRIPVGYLYCMGNTRADWCFRTEPESALGGRALNYPRGRVLGGSSAINGMIYMRGQARDYDIWRQRGCAGWGWDDVLPFFRKSEDYFAGADAYHGVGGELRIEAQRTHWPILEAFRAASIQAGIPASNDFNRGDNDGVGYFRVTQRRGVRLSAAGAFLRPALKRANLRLLTGAVVQSVRTAARQATGVAFWRDGLLCLARARLVILTAGATGSPHILEASGIGDAGRLRGLGIAVVHDSPGVGENLQDHLQLRCAWRVSGAKTLNDRAARWHGKAGIALEYALRRSGPMAMSPSQLGAFARSDPSYETPNLQYHVQPLTLESFGQPLDCEPGFTASVCNLRPESRGSVHAVDADARVAPRIAPNYLATHRDRQVAADSITLTRRIVAQPALARYRPLEVKPGVEAQGEQALIEAAGRIGTTIFHPVGTARMGSDEAAVVDTALRVRGVGGLHVIDASIMPTIVSGNTNAPTIMIAEKAAAMLAADPR